MENYFLPNSFQVPNFIVDQLIQTISPNALKIYLIIIRKTKGWNKEADYISISQLQTLSGIKKNETIFKVLKELESQNLIFAEKNKGKMSRFSVVPFIGTTTKKGDEVIPKNGTTTTTKKRYTTKTTNTKTINTKKEEIEIYPAELNVCAFEQWVSYKKNKLTRTQKNLIIKKLVQFDFETQNQMIENSIMNGWSGLFEVKRNQNFGSKLNTQQSLNNIQSVLNLKERGVL